MHGTGWWREVVESRARKFKDPVAVLVHSLLLLTNMVQYAVVPLLPTLQHDFRLSAATLSLMLALPSLTMIVAAIPAGWLCDRLGARQLTYAAAVVLTLSCVLQALPGLLCFALGRFFYGVAMTAVWTSGPAWLSESRKGSSGRVGAVVTSGAVGAIAGPLLGGALADHFGLGAPFAVFAVVSVGLTLPLIPTKPKAAVSRRRISTRWTAVAAQVPSSPELRAALAAMVAVGGVAGAVALLAPLQLSRAGVSTSTIGLVFAASGLVYVLASATVSMARPASVGSVAVVLGCLVMALTVAPAGFTTSSAVLVTCLLVFTVPRAQLNTVGYRLAASSDAARIGNLGAVVGLLNLVWATSMSVGPIAAAWLASGFGIGPAFLATAIWAAGVGILLAAVIRLRRGPTVEAGVYHLPTRRTGRAA